MITSNATISNVFLGFEDHGIFTFMIDLDYGKSGTQWYGNYQLSHRDVDGTIHGSENGIDILIGIINAVGVNSWEGLKGKNCRVRRDGEMGQVTAIGHFLNKDQWFSMEKFI